MSKGIKFVLAASVAASFWACGDGEIIQSGVDEEVGLQQVLHNRVLVDDALRACLADSSGCKKDMENAPVTEVPSSDSADNEEAKSSASTPSTGGNEDNPTIDDPPIILPENSGSSGVASSSSQGSTAVKGVRGRCFVSPADPEKKKEVTYSFQQVGSAPTLESLEWTIPEDAEVVTSSIEGLTMEVVVKYAKVGKPSTVSVVPNKGLESQGASVGCGIPTVKGPAVTGCSCKPTLKSSSNDVKNGAVSYEWSVSGCSSVDAEGESAGPFTYSWSGTGVSGSAEKVTGSYTTMGKYSATVAVTNADGVSGEFVCSEKAEVFMDGESSCNSKNSIVLTTDGTDNNKAEMDLIANKCYAYTFAKRNYAASMQIGNWSGSTAYINVTGCDGSELENVEILGNGQFVAVPGGFTGSNSCTAFIQPKSNVKLQINNW